VSQKGATSQWSQPVWSPILEIHVPMLSNVLMATLIRFLWRVERACQHVSQHGGTL
jgi:hypothetical protein